MNPEGKNNELKIEIILKDPRAIDVVKKLPEDKRDEIIENYILLGDTVVSYASIVTSEASLQKFFEPSLNDLCLLSKNFETILEDLKGRIPETLQASLSGIAQQLTGVAQSLEQSHANYTEMLSKIFPTLAKTKRGTISSEMVLRELQESFREDKFEDVSSKARFTDIMAVPSFATEPILIENKDYTDPVGSDEVEKFWRDMEVRNATIGCFFSLRSSIRTVTSDFAIVPKGSRLGIFVVNEEFNHRGHIFGYIVARKILEMQKRVPSVKEEKYELIAKILNNRLRDIRETAQDLEAVENAIKTARGNVVAALDSIVLQVSNLRGRINQIIESTFEDLGGETGPK